MATSLNTTTEKTTGGAKKYLDYSGLNKLWDNICDKFSPKWQTVDFDFLNNPTSDAELKTLQLPIRTLSPAPDNNGVIDHTQRLQKTLVFPQASADNAGVMSAADKKKLDDLSTSIEGAITIKSIKIGNQLSGGSTFNATALTADGNKALAFGLSYNADSDLLSLVDLNNSKKALSQVHILGDAFKSAIFSDCEVKYKNSNTYLVFTLTIKKQDGTDDVKTVEILVNDLISTYHAGDGIKIDQTSTDIDGSNTATTITLIAPLTKDSKHKIGGIIPKKIYSNSITDTDWGNATGTTVPTIQALGTSTGRYFGVETDNAGHAFVNVPVVGFERGTDTNATATVNNTAANGSFTAMTGLEWSLSADGTKYTLTPKYTDFSVQTETVLSVNANHAINQSDIALAGNTNKSISYVKGLSVSDHGITVNTGSFNIKESELAFATDVNATAVTLVPGTTTSITPITGLTKDAHHTLKRTYTSVTVADPASIELTYIAGLKYQIPS